MCVCVRTQLRREVGGGGRELLGGYLEGGGGYEDLVRVNARGLQYKGVYKL